VLCAHFRKAVVVRAWIAAMFLVLSVAAAGPAWAQISAEGSSFDIPVQAGGIRWPDIAFDASHSVYLAVTGMGTIRGRFIRPDGTYASDPFQINSSTAYAQMPKTLCNPAAGSCLVVWVDGRNLTTNPNIPDLYGRIVSVGVGSTPVFVTGDFPVSVIGAGVYWDNGRPGMAYSTASREYFVAWHQSSDGSVRGQAVSDAGQLVGSNVAIQADGNYHDQVAAAYNPATDRFLVGYEGSATGVNFEEARWVQAGTQPAVVGPAVRVMNGAVPTTGVWGGDAVTNTTTGKLILLFRYAPGAGDPNVYGTYVQRFNPDGSTDGAPFVIAPVTSGFSHYDAMRTDYNPYTNTFVMATHSFTAEDGALELNSDGTPIGTGQIITSIGGTGNYNPAIAADPTQAQWLLVTSAEFASLWGQFIQSGTREGGGGGQTSFYKLSPANTSTGVSIPATLSWSAMSGATAYQVCVTTTSGGTCDTGWQSAGTSLSAQASNLATSTTYYWQVQADVSGSWVNASGGWWSFATQVAGAGQLSWSGSASAVSGTSGGVVLPEVAYESVNGAYLAVTGTATIQGVFIRPNGTLATSAFRIDSGTVYAQTPKVWCSPSAGSCLVVWSDSRNNNSNGYPDLYGRVVALGNGVPTFISGDFAISAIGAGVRWKTRPGLSYSTTSHQYLVTWPQLNDNEIHGRLIGDTGTLLGSDMSITTDSSVHDRSAVAYNPTTNCFLVGYQGSSTYNFIESRWVQAGASAGPTGSAMRVLNGVVPATALYGGDVAYNSATGKLVQLFYLQPGAGDSSSTGIYAQRYTAAGSFDGSPFAVSTSYGGYDALRMAYNPVSNTFALATYSGGAEDVVIELNQDGTPNSGMLTTSLGGTGNFNPAVAAHPTQAQWLLVTAHSNTSLDYEFITTSSREPAAGSLAKSTPANGASSVSIPVALSWGAASGATAYQYCVSTSTGTCPGNSWTSTGTQTTATVSSLAAGTPYYWQVQAYVSGAWVNADSGTWWSFTTQAAPALFNKLTPSTGATGQTDPVTLTWSAASGATAYQVCVTTTSTGTCDTGWQSAGTLLSIQLSSFTAGATYYWQVQAEVSGARVSADSGTWWNFVMQAAPASFAKLTPVSGTANLTSSVAVTWASVTNNSGFEYCLSSTGPTCTTWTANALSTTTTFSGLSNGTYYWQVRATVDNTLVYADNSTWWVFYVGPQPFGKSAPASGTTLTANAPTLSWMTASGATYLVCVDTTNDSSCGTGWFSTSATSVSLAGLAPGPYYWQVRAVTGVTTDGDGGTWWSFTVPAPAFSKSAPAESATGLASYVPVSWGSAAGATNYDVCVTSTGPICDTGWRSNATSTASGFTLTAGTWYWQVRATVAGSLVYADNATWNTFTVGTAAATFGKAAPTNGAGGVTNPVTLSWATVSGATFELCVDVTSDRVCHTAWISVGTATSATVSGLAPGTFYWQVRATATTTREADAGTWWSFTVPVVSASFGKLTPTTGATGQTSPVTVTWSAMSGATAYQVCATTTNGSSCDTSWQSAGTSLSAQISNLTAGDTYYWQVQAEVSGAWVNADAGTWWSFAMAATPGAFGKSAPVNGTTLTGNAPTLSWATASGATYLVCVDTTNDSACGTNWVSTSATSLSIEGLAPGTYYWQVRAVTGVTTDADGGTWWSFIVPAPAFSKLAPAASATGLATYVPVSWGTAAGATNYDVCVTSTGPTCDTGWRSNATSTASGFTLSAGTYYWQVRATVGGSLVYADNATWNTFTVGTAAATFGKAAPANGATGVASPVALSWATVSGATFELCVDTTNDHVCHTEWVNVGTATSATVTGLSPGTFYWQVRATATTTREADAGAWWSFTVASAAFGKLTPTTGATGQTSPVTVTWSAASGATAYQVCATTTNGSSCDTSWQSAGTSLTAQLSSLTAGDTYYWQVQAEVSGAWVNADAGTWWNFAVAAAPGAFGKSAPVSGTTLTGNAPTLSWATSSGATYLVCVDTTNDSACGTGWVSTSATSIVLNGLAPGTYYWQVRAVAAGTTDADGGTWWSFTVPAPAFTKTAPAASATGLASYVPMSWGSAAGATNYDVCVTSTGPTCDTGWRPNAMSTATGFTLSAGTWYWQVRATVNGSLVYADNATWNTFTVGTATATFGKAAPTNGAAGVTSPATLSWATVAGATFELCVGVTSDRVCHTGWFTVGSGTSATVTGLPAGTYYWQVRATTTTTREADAGAWWSFTANAPI
jgi:hypothetical protein